MSPLEINTHWYDSPYTGLFSESGWIPPQAHDPQVPIWSGLAPLQGPGNEPLASGGAGWDKLSAEAAGVGESIERWQAWPLPCDQIIESTLEDWPLNEPIIPLNQWVLFHEDQYELSWFPYQRLTEKSLCQWVCARDVFTGSPFWVPTELVYLSLPLGQSPQYCPLISSGLSCGRWNHPVLLRGVQETIERDAVMGASWGRYFIREINAKSVLNSLEDSVLSKILRPNLTYRFYWIDTPFSDHVTVVTLEGEDHVGYCFSVGAACRETRNSSWLKAILEAIQGRYYVRYLKEKYQRQRFVVDKPTNFAEHAVYYSLYPERLKETVLNSPPIVDISDRSETTETLDRLKERLGAEHPILFRNLTPPGIASAQLDWLVLRVMVPGLQPMHGHHYLPFLGGSLWAPRRWEEWLTMPPHPFP